MNKLTSLAILAASIAVASTAMAQTPADPQPSATPSAAPADDGAAPARGGRPEPKLERIQHTDSANTIDEVRIGGEDQNITVTPHNRAPSYEVVPEKSLSRPNQGQRVWNLMKF